MVYRRWAEHQHRLLMRSTSINPRNFALISFLEAHIAPLANRPRSGRLPVVRRSTIHPCSVSVSAGSIQRQGNTMAVGTSKFMGDFEELGHQASADTEPAQRAGHRVFLTGPPLFRQISCRYLRRMDQSRHYARIVSPGGKPRPRAVKVHKKLSPGDRLNVR